MEHRAFNRCVDEAMQNKKKKKKAEEIVDSERVLSDS